MKRNIQPKQEWLGYLFIAPNMLGIIAFFLAPALFSLILVFTNWNFTNQQDVSFVGFDNFARLWSDKVFLIAVKNTLIFVAAVPISILLAFLVAVALNRSIRMKGVLRAMYFMPYITSGVAVAFVWMLLFEPDVGPINSMLRAIGFAQTPAWLSSTDTSMFAIDIIWIWFMLGYNMIIYLAALQEISEELLEAARIDGARPWYTIRKIVFPLVSPTTLLLTITGFIATIKQFGIIQAVTEGGPGNSTTVLSLYVYKTAFRYYEMGYASAISWILFAIVLLVTLLQWFSQKKWVHY